MSIVGDSAVHVCDVDVDVYEGIYGISVYCEAFSLSLIGGSLDMLMSDAVVQ